MVFDRLLWPFVLRGKITPAQPLTFFFLPFFPLFLCLGVASTGSDGESEPCSEEEPADTARGVDSVELELQGRALVGDPDPAKGSKPKNDQRLDDLVGLGVGEATADVSATSSNAGIELRRLGERFDPFVTLELCMPSRMAPAVLGLESAMSRVGLRDSGAGLSLPLGEAPDIMEDRLSDTEWPGRAVAVLEVSLETMDSGRGMYSKVSENPTRARVPDLACFGLPLAAGSSASSTGVISSGCWRETGRGSGGPFDNPGPTRDM